MKLRASLILNTHSTEEPVCLYLRQTRFIPIYDLTSVSQGLGYAPPVTLTINGSVLPVLEMHNHVFVLKGYMTTLL